MGMTCYIAHIFVAAVDKSAYFELGFDNERRPNIVVTESFIDDFADPSIRRALINDAFDANYIWREGDQYSYYSSDPWEDEKPHTLADELEDTWGDEKRQFDNFLKTVEKMNDVKYVLLATDATKPSENDGAFWYDVLVCDFHNKNLVKIEWRGAWNTYCETHYGDNMFNEEKAKEIIALLDQNGINQIDIGDYELDGVLQGQVVEFPIIGSSKVPNNNQCIHILPKQKNEDSDFQNNQQKHDDIEAHIIMDANKIDTSDKEPAAMAMKEALSHFATGISASQENIIGLKSDGTVVASMVQESDIFDLNRGQLDVHDWRDIIMISAAAAHTVGLKSDGTVVSTSITAEDWDYGQTAVDDWTDIIMVSAGRHHTVGLKSDGTVVSTSITTEGFDFGQTAVSDWSDIVMVSAGTNHTVGLKSDGTVISTSITPEKWDYGQTAVEDWKDIVMVSTKDEHTVGLKSDGTVLAVGSNEYFQTEVSDWDNIIAVSAGVEHTIGLKADGTVIGVGGDPVNVWPLRELDGWKNVTAISAGYSYNLGLKTDGTIVFAPMDSSYDIDENLIDYDEWKDIVNRGL